MNKSNQSFNKFLLLWGGELISAIGSGLTSFGLGIYVFNQTGKASAMALVTLLAFMPSLLLAPLAGILADRYDRRLLMVMGDSFSAIGLVYILMCLLGGEARLWQICVGVTISSVFASLLEPSYRATLTDLLSEEEYTRAGGLVQIAENARYLISPVLAGFLLVISDIKLLLIIDICTFFVTVTATLVVRKGLESKKVEEDLAFVPALKEGWEAICAKQGILTLVIIASIMTFFMGFIQTLAIPMTLAFTTAAAVGTLETVIGVGMLVTSVVLAVKPLKKNYVKTLAGALFFAGVGMALFGLRENMMLLVGAGFLFFAMLPCANVSIDYLLRTNIDNAVQGRAWALMSVISQFGFIAAYGTAGLLADYIFTPLLVEGGTLAGSIGKIIGVGSGRGTGLLISIAGVLLSVTAIILYQIKSVRALEKRGEACIEN